MAPKNPKTAAQFEKKVRAAAIELEKEGARITNAAIREKIDGGSFRDIAPIVKAITAEKEARTKAESLVPDMPEDVAELATAIWEGAYRAADEVAANDRRVHAEEVKALREEVAERENEIATVEEELDGAQARAEVAEAAMSKLEGQLTELRMVIAGLEGRLLGREEANKKNDKGRKTAAPEPEDDRQISFLDDPEEVDEPSASDLHGEADGGEAGGIKENDDDFGDVAA
jgi:chromosome segregation ATPase